MNITKDTKIMRFLNVDAARKSIGTVENEQLKFCFHYGLLSDYQTSESASGDSKERSVNVNYNNFQAMHHTGTDALISCWTILEENTDVKNVQSMEN